MGDKSVFPGVRRCFRFKSRSASWQSLSCTPPSSSRLLLVQLRHRPRHQTASLPLANARTVALRVLRAPRAVIFVSTTLRKSVAHAQVTQIGAAEKNHPAFVLEGRRLASRGTTPRLAVMLPLKLGAGLGAIMAFVAAKRMARLAVHLRWGLERQNVARKGPLAAWA